MTNESVKLYPHDYLLAWILVPLTPKFVKPNHLTVLRILLIPFVLAALWHESWYWSLGLFLFADTKWKKCRNPNTTYKTLMIS